MSLVNIGFFCITGNPIIQKYKTVGSDQGQPDSYDRVKEFWLKIEGQIVIEQEVDSATFKPAELCNVDGVICQNDVVCRADCKDTHFSSIKGRRKEIQFGWLRCTTPEGTKDFFADTDNRGIINGSIPVVNEDPTLIAQEFPEIEVKTNSGVWYVIKENEVYPVYRGVHFTTQALFNKEKAVQVIIDADFANELVTLEVFENTDYVAVFNAQFEAKLADSANPTIYGQPITEKQVQL